MGPALVPIEPFSLPGSALCFLLLTRGIRASSSSSTMVNLLWCCQVTDQAHSLLCCPAEKVDSQDMRHH